MDQEEKINLTNRFTKELWPLNKSGNAEMALSELLHAINDNILFDGGPLTFDHIKAKYVDYLRYMKLMNSERESRYHTKIDDLTTFIGRKRYNEDFIPDTNSNLDLYLYGE